MGAGAPMREAVKRACVVGGRWGGKEALRFPGG